DAVDHLVDGPVTPGGDDGVVALTGRGFGLRRSLAGRFGDDQVALDPQRVKGIDGGRGLGFGSPAIGIWIQNDFNAHGNDLDAGMGNQVMAARSAPGRLVIRPWTPKSINRRASAGSSTVQTFTRRPRRRAQAIMA